MSEKFPPWLHQKLTKGFLCKTNAVLQNDNIITVCEEASCPNRIECFSKKTATFLALGSKCTRSCSFCDIDFDKCPAEPDEKEPQKIADAAEKLSLEHIVITMVCRDDLPDQGAFHMAKIIQKLRELSKKPTIEVLVSDFSGNLELADIILNEKPDVFNHNIETVKELSNKIRHKAFYERSLQVLRHAKKSNKALFIKSGLMVGLGENDRQVKEAIKDLYIAGCNVITIGQYLQPNIHKLPIKSFVTPDQFKKYKDYGESLGVENIYAGPFVRSSYNAHKITKDLIKN